MSQIPHQSTGIGYFFRWIRNQRELGPVPSFDPQDEGGRDGIQHKNLLHPLDRRRAQRRIHKEQDPPPSRCACHLPRQDGGGTRACESLLKDKARSPGLHLSMSLIVTGTIGIDTVETPGGGRREDLLGGSAVYFAAAASFYTQTRLVAAVGDDFPDEFLQSLKSFEGLDTAGLEIRQGSKTFRWGGKYHEDMDHRDTLFTDLGVLEEAPPSVPEVFKDSEVVFLANSHPMVQMGMLEQFPDAKLVVADTMDLWITIAKPELEQLLSKVDGLVLNFDEAEQYTGHRNPVSAGKHLLELGPRFVVIKKGEHGCILVHKDGICALPAYPTENVVDPTGAGDSFAGGLMGRLAARGGRDLGSFKSVREALAHGTIIASFNVESFSLDRMRNITRKEVDARFDEFAEMIKLG